jgi:SAM-dependent methyltransferase
MAQMSLGTGAAWYDVRYVPRLPAALVRHIVLDLGLDGTGVLLDLECGTGDLTLRMADWFESVVAVDPLWEKLTEARRLASEQQAKTVRWYGSLGEAEGVAGDFRLVIARTECRWLADGSLAEAASRLQPHGALALVGTRQVDSPSWAAVTEMVERYGGRLSAGHLPDPGAEKILDEASLNETGGIDIVVEERSSTEDLIGLIYATGGLAPAQLGDRQDEFEDAVEQIVESEAARGRFHMEQTVSLRLFRR